jgi:hypothetical protein
MTVVNNPRVAIGVAALTGLAALGGVGAVMSSHTDTGFGAARIDVTEVATTTKTRTSTTSTTSPSTSATASADDAARLFGLLPAGFNQSNCSVPSDGGVGDSTVTLDCTQAAAPNGPTNATFALFPNQRLLDKHFQGFVGEDQISDCPGGLTSPGNWHYNDTPDVVAGRIACGTFKGTPDLVWTQNADLLIGNFQGSDLDSLYNYWASPGGNTMAPQFRHN